jgi:hypothetical protein
LSDNQYALAFYKHNFIGGDLDPNTAPPDPTRILRTPHLVETYGYSALLSVMDGTSLVVTCWFNDPLSGVWVPLTKPLVVNAGEPTYVVVPADANIFTQLGANVGVVTKFGVGWMGLDAVSSEMIAAPIPAGSATAANQTSEIADLDIIKAQLAPKIAYQSVALEAAAVIKAGAGTAFTVLGRVDSTAVSATYYVQLVNRTAAGAEGVYAAGELLSVLKVIHILGTDDDFDFKISIGGIVASVGIVCLISSTEFTKTISGASLNVYAEHS